jgi:DNA repair photolyase
MGGCGGRFSIFMSSATDPFVPQEDRFRVTRGVLETMLELPPDTLILQTHSHRVIHYVELIRELSRRCELRVHISIESDRERLPGLPPPASPLVRRFDAAAALREAGIRVVITVSPLLPIERPREFFERIAGVADGVVIDHFVGGDGSPDGTRTRMTGLPEPWTPWNPARASSVTWTTSWRWPVA